MTPLDFGTIELIAKSFDEITEHPCLEGDKEPL
jgi:hypothetical protein